MAEIETRLHTALARRLDEAGFTRRRDVWRRQGEIPQEAAVVASRLGRALRGGAAWVEVRVGLPGDAHGAPPVLALRQNQIAATMAPYLTVETPEAEFDAAVEAVAAFLLASGDADGLVAVLNELGAAGEYGHIQGMVLARQGRTEAARAAFATSPLDPDTLRMTVAAYLVEIDL